MLARWYLSLRHRCWAIDLTKHRARREVSESELSVEILVGWLRTTQDTKTRKRAGCSSRGLYWLGTEWRVRPERMGEENSEKRAG